MKKVLLLPLLFYSNILFCQDTVDYAKIKLTEPSDYKFAESSVLYAANFLLTRPFSSKDLQPFKASKFIFNWISGTPYYTFPFGNVDKVTNGNDDLYTIYLACIAKFRIENEDVAMDINFIQLNSVKILIEYCNNKNNKVKLTKHLKKLIQANEKGQPEKALE